MLTQNVLSNSIKLEILFKDLFFFVTYISLMQYLSSLSAIYHHVLLRRPRGENWYWGVLIFAFLGYLLTANIWGKSLLPTGKYR